MMAIPSNPIPASRLCHTDRWLALVRCMALVTLLGLAACTVCAQSSGTEGPAASVNPLIGTGGDPDDGINLFPGATTPFGMVQLSPDTEEHGAGYHYIQTRIKGFSMTHMSGAGCANSGECVFHGDHRTSRHASFGLSIALLAQNGNGETGLLSGATAAMGDQRGTERHRSYRRGPIYISRRKSRQYCCPNQPHAQQHLRGFGACCGR